MENEEVQRLLLAAEVRTFAFELRRHDAALAYRALQDAEKEGPFDQFHAKFGKEHALAEYIPKAVAQLREIAELMG